MIQAGWEIQLIAVVTAVACALPGCFLVLRRLAMLTDAISHAILPGIVIGFFLVHDLGSPVLILAAAATGLVTVWLVELVLQTGNLREDASIGLVFPALFSVGVILISRYAGDVHLDLDAVLMGELAFAPFDRILVAGRDIGPRSLYVMLGILVLNLIVLGAMYKELKLAAFDPGLATLLGFSPVVLHYGFMGLVSVTVVGAFDSVGSILVIALFVAPPATAYMWTDRLGRMLGVSAGAGAASAVLGYWGAHAADVNIGGAMATAAGLLFLVTALIAPERGVVAVWRRRREQLMDVRLQMLAVHLFHHENEPEYAREADLATLHQHLTWSREETRRVAAEARRRQLVTEEGGLLELTGPGRRRAQRAVTAT